MTFNLDSTFTYAPSRDFNGSNGFTYAPSRDFNGSNGFTFKANDAQAESNTVTVVNDAPVAITDSYATNEDTPLPVVTPRVRNGCDVDRPALTEVLVSEPTHGSLTLKRDGSFSDTPSADYNYNVSCRDQTRDRLVALSTVTVVPITIYSVNDPPTTITDSATRPADTPVTIGVLANDFNVDGDALVLTSVTQGAHGGVVINGDGTLTYTPGTNFTGIDTFTYPVNDGEDGKGPGPAVSRKHTARRQRCLPSRV